MLCGNPGVKDNDNGLALGIWAPGALVYRRQGCVYNCILQSYTPGDCSAVCMCRWTHWHMYNCTQGQAGLSARHASVNVQRGVFLCSGNSFTKVELWTWPPAMGGGGGEGGLSGTSLRGVAIG